jgi:phosphate transport system protein
MQMTRTQFEQELELLRSQLLEMGSAADRMVELAMLALTTQDVSTAEAVILSDDRIDELDLQIEAASMKLIALQQPMARDLRLVGTALKVITDLERIGDHAVDIAKIARKLAGEAFPKPLVDLPRMATAVRKMLRDALEAFVRHDLSLVNRVVEADDEVDTLFHQIRDELLTTMQREPGIVYRATYLLFVAHYLERIADHAVNIAERVHYVETGELAQLARSHRNAS